MSMYECPKCGGVPGVTVCCSDAQTAQAGHVPEASCGECGKKASDGWALYCVACMEKAGLPAVTDSPPLMHSCTSSLGKTPDSTAQAVPLLSDDEIKAAALEAFNCTWDADDETLVNKYGHGVYLWRFIDFARAIEQAVLAKRVPMTPEETDAAMKLLFYPARNRAFVDGVEAAERHHGIAGEKGVAT